MKKHFLLKHYVLESAGRETPTAAFVKFFGRQQYYENMGRRMSDPAIATRLELVDRRAKEAAAVCPFPTGEAFRKFIVVGDSIEAVNERVRLAQEMAVQLRKARTEFQAYSFSAKDKLENALRSISRAVDSVSPEHIRDYAAIVRCVLGVKQYVIPLVDPAAVLPNPNIPLTTCTDLEIYLSTHAVHVPVSDWNERVRNARSGLVFKY